METVLILMTVGILTGLFIARFPKLVKLNDKLTSWAIYLLLFLLGISVGTNNKIISNLDSIGWQAILLTVGAVAGSVLVLWMVYRFFFRLK